MQTKELIKDCIKGNRTAQAALYQLYAPKMLGVCYRYTKQLEDAEDILQESFIKVFQHMGSYQQKVPIESWIRRIVVNTAISYLKKHSKYRNEMQIDAISMHPISNDNPSINLDTKELIECIRKLPTGYQTIFNLVALEGFEYAEVATMLEMNLNTVRSQYSRARALLINYIKEQNNHYQKGTHAK